MSIYESTVAMLELLSEDDLEAVNGIVKRLVIKTHSENPYKKLTKEEMLEQLSEARTYVANGKFKTGDQVAENLGKKYGFDTIKLE